MNEISMRSIEYTNKDRARNLSIWLDKFKDAKSSELELYALDALVQHCGFDTHELVLISWVPQQYHTISIQHKIWVIHKFFLNFIDRLVFDSSVILQQNVRNELKKNIDIASRYLEKQTKTRLIQGFTSMINRIQSWRILWVTQNFVENVLREAIHQSEKQWSVDHWDNHGNKKQKNIDRLIAFLLLKIPPYRDKNEITKLFSIDLPLWSIADRTYFVLHNQLPKETYGNNTTWRDIAQILQNSK